MPLDHDLKIELAERADALMAPTGERLVMRHGSLPHYWGGFALPGTLGIAVGLATMLGLGLALSWVWPAAPDPAYLAAVAAGVFAGARASRGAERHMYWIIGELKRGRDHG